MNTSSTTFKPVRGRFFDDSEYVVIQVEHVLHRIPKQRLEVFSDVFKDMFLLPQGDDDSVLEGTSESNPIYLEGCKNIDFENLMELILPTSIPYIELTKEQLVGVLDLASKWEMQGIKRYTFEHLVKLDLTPIEKISIGRKFDLPEFIRQGSIALVKEDRPPPLDDILKIGWDTFGQITYAKERIMEGYGTTHVKAATLKCTKCNYDLKASNAKGAGVKCPQQYGHVGNLTDVHTSTRDVQRRLGDDALGDHEIHAELEAAMKGIAKPSLSPRNLRGLFGLA